MAQLPAGTGHYGRVNILFVCSRNQWRSRTAETLFKNHGTHRVKSAGTSPTARIRVSAGLLRWADLVYVMERRHAELLAERFPELQESYACTILDIPDEYRYLDEELVEELRAGVEDIL